MKEHIYETSFSKRLNKSFLIWLCVFAQIFITSYIILINNDRTTVALIGANVFFTFLNLPGLLIHFNFLKEANARKVIIKYDSITVQKHQELITLKLEEIQKIEIYESPKGSRSPWWNYSYFKLTDSKNNEIRINNYIMEISELWNDSLVRKLKSDSIVTNKKFLPIII